MATQWIIPVVLLVFFVIFVPLNEVTMLYLDINSNNQIGNFAFGATKAPIITTLLSNIRPNTFYYLYVKDVNGTVLYRGYVSSGQNKIPIKGNLLGYKLYVELYTNFQGIGWKDTDMKTYTLSIKND